MAPITILFGILLILLSFGTYFPAPAESKHWTIFIPSFFGVSLIALGFLARKDKLRMHAMHTAAVIALCGFIIPAFRVVGALAEGRELNLAMTASILMALLCGAFVGLCVKSFIDARRRRKEES